MIFQHADHQSPRLSNIHYFSRFTCQLLLNNFTYLFQVSKSTVCRHGFAVFDHIWKMFSMTLTSERMTLKVSA